MQKIFLICLFLVSFSMTSFASPRFEADVSVDETAKTVTEAKQKALSKAMRQGINEIVLNISNEKSVTEINKLNDNQLEHFITGIMVLMEKSSDVRYIADLRISIDGELLKAYMAENDMPLILNEEQQFAVIPVLEKENGSLDIWSEENFWWQAFLDKHPLHKGNIDIRLIDKNLGNIAMIKPENIYNLTSPEIDELLSFNHTDAIYVLKYSLKDNKVHIKSYPDKIEETVNIDKSSLPATIDSLFPFFKPTGNHTPTTYNRDVLENIEVVFNYHQLSEWTDLKKQLDNHPQIQNIKVLSMSNGQVHFNFEYSGIIEKLQGQLEVYGYKMRSEGGYYAIN